jgi:hypothetical protein
LNCLPRRVARTNSFGERAGATRGLAAPLELVAGLRKGGEAAVARHDALDLRPDRGAAREVDPVVRAGLHRACELEQELPLAARLADRVAVDLGREDDAALGARLGPAVPLLVARARGQEVDDAGLVLGLDEHL